MTPDEIRKLAAEIRGAAQPLAFAEPQGPGSTHYRLALEQRNVARALAAQARILAMVATELEHESHGARREGSGT